MKRLLLALLLIGASFPAYAQISPPCYTTTGSNCIPVGTTTPLPVGNASPTVVYISPSTVPYTYTPTTDKQLNYVHVIFNASSTVSNRLVVLKLVDTDSNTVGDWHVTPAITAGQTRHIEFMPGIYREATFDANGTVQSPFPTGLIIPKNYSLIVADNTGVVTNDTMTIGLQVK
jgi:hypothetical protein